MVVAVGPVWTAEEDEDEDEDVVPALVEEKGGSDSGSALAVGGISSFSSALRIF